MKFDHLIHFLETARQQHLTKAASILRISPSAVSYSIQCLEEELGVALFEKRGKRIFLTDPGHRLLRKIPDVQRSLSDLRSHVTSDAGFEGHYRLGASHVLAETILAPAAAEVFGSSASVTFDLFSLRSAEVIARILDEQLEVGICFSPQDHPRMQTRVLLEGNLKIYVRPQHPLLKTKSPLKFLTSYPAALPKAFGGIDVCETHEVFKLHGVHPRTRFTFDHYGVAAALVTKSDAWGFFPDYLENPSEFDLAAIALPKNWKAPYTISAVSLKDRFIDGGLESLLRAISHRVAGSRPKQTGN